MSKEFNFDRTGISSQRDESGPMIIMTSVFILWGFLTLMNDNLNAKIQTILNLSDTQESLLSFVFFAWYFVTGLFFFLISRYVFDPIEKFGYKNLVIIGLLITAIACFLFYPATTLIEPIDLSQLSTKQAQEMQWSFFSTTSVILIILFLISHFFTPNKKIGYKRLIILAILILGTAYFIFHQAPSIPGSLSLSQESKFIFFVSTVIVLATGFAILQIAANPYVLLMGEDQTAAARLNLSQGFNSFGAYLAPIISTLLFFEADHNTSTQSLKSVTLIYIVLGIAISFLAFLFYIAVLPDIKIQTKKSVLNNKKILNERHLLLGALAIFLYVGGEVAIGSHLEDYLKLDNISGLDEVIAKKYVAIYWGGAMAGRFAGALFLSRLERRSRNGIIILLIILTYLLGYSSTSNSISALIFTGLFIGNLIGFQIGQGRSARTLSVFALIVIGCILLSILTEGNLSMWALLVIGMFNSVMFPNIFRLALRNLKHKTSTGSALLILSIVGGAFIPALQNIVINTLDVALKYSFLVPALCYVYIAYFGLSTSEK